MFDLVMQTLAEGLQSKGSQGCLQCGAYSVGPTIWGAYNLGAYNLGVLSGGPL